MTTNEKVSKLLELTGVRAGVAAELQGIKDALPSEALVKLLRGRTDEQLLEQIVESIIPVYSREFSESEIDVLLTYFGTDVMRHFIRAAQPLAENCVKAFQAELSKMIR